MKFTYLNFLNIGPRLTLSFAVLITLILGGNGLLVWQFHLASVQTDRLTAANQQVIAVLRLQGGLLFFHQRLDELEQSRNAYTLASEAEPLRRNLLEQIQGTRSELTHLSSESRLDPDLLPALDSIEITLQSQLGAITKLARSGDWIAVRLRLTSELTPLETHTAALVKSTDQEVSEELTQIVGNMRYVQRNILLLVPAMAMSTFCIATFFGWAITRRIVELRIEERVGERTRLARELHDTLLQSLHGLMFQFQAARNMLPRRTEEAMQALDEAISATEQAITESRGAIQDLRSEHVAQSDLAELLTTMGQELTDVQNTDHDSPIFRVIVEGERQTLAPVLQNEVCRIAREILRNAVRHAHAHRIEAEIRYDDQGLRLRIRDDGRGLDPKVLEEGGSVGHWGLRGMRERAQQIGAQLDFWSEAGAGTEVQLTVPTAVAYKSSRDGFRFKLLKMVKGYAKRS